LLFESIFFSLIFIFTGVFSKKKKKKNVPTIFCYNDIFLSRDSLVINENVSFFGVFVYFLYNAFAVGLLIFSYSYFLCYSNFLTFFDLFLFLNGLTSNNFFVKEAFSFHFCITLFFVFIFFSFFIFKIGLFPFHNWVIRLLMSLNYYSLFILLVLFKFIVFFTFIKVLYACFYSVAFYLQNIFFIICIITLIIGSAGIYLQYNIRKFLAYSTLTHSSYIISSLFCDSPYGLYGAVIYLLVYLVSTSAFLFFGLFTFNFLKKKSIFSFLELSEIGYYKKPYYAIIILLFSMAGLPPLAGFWVKLYVLESLVEQNTFLSWLLILVIVLTTCITTIGYLRIIKIFFLKPKQNVSFISIYPGSYLFIIRFLSFFLMFFFIGLIFIHPDNFLDVYLYFRLNF